MYQTRIWAFHRHKIKPHTVVKGCLRTSSLMKYEQWITEFDNQRIDLKQQMTGQRTMRKFVICFCCCKIRANPTSLQCHRTGCPGRPCTQTSSGYLSFV